MHLQQNFNYTLNFIVCVIIHINNSLFQLLLVRKEISKGKNMVGAARIQNTLLLVASRRWTIRVIYESSSLSCATFELSPTLAYLWPTWDNFSSNDPFTIIGVFFLFKILLLRLRPRSSLSTLILIFRSTPDHQCIWVWILVNFLVEFMILIVH